MRGCVGTAVSWLVLSVRARALVCALAGGHLSIPFDPDHHLYAALTDYFTEDIRKNSCVLPRTPSPSPAHPLRVWAVRQPPARPACGPLLPLDQHGVARQC